MSSHDTMIQPRGVTMRRVRESTNPDEHLLEQILSKSNLRQAWKRVKANKGKPGVDHMSIEEFPMFAKTD